MVAAFAVTSDIAVSVELSVFDMYGTCSTVLFDDREASNISRLLEPVIVADDGTKGNTRVST